MLLGHSQGAGMITRLIEDEIDDEPLLRDRLVAAYVLGSSLQVPDGEVVGGDFADVPLCEAEDQTGCVVTYSSYRSTDPPAGVAFFGRGGDGTRAGCVNPAAVGGGAATVQPYFLVRPDRRIAARRVDGRAALRRPGPHGRDHHPVGHVPRPRRGRVRLARATTRTSRSP